MIANCNDEEMDTSEDPSDEDTDDKGFEYKIYHKTGLRLKVNKTTKAFLMKDRGNVVHFHLGGFRMKITLYVMPDPESLTVEKLEKELKRRGLSGSAERTLLVARLQQLIH
jgi:hypothetical protein